MTRRTRRCALIRFAQGVSCVDELLLLQKKRKSEGAADQSMEVDGEAASSSKKDKKEKVCSYTHSLTLLLRSWLMFRRAEEGQGC